MDAAGLRREESAETDAARDANIVRGDGSPADAESPRRRVRRDQRDGERLRRRARRYIPCVDEHDKFDDAAPKISLTGLQSRFTLTNAVTGQKLTFRVRARNKHGWSAWSRPSAAVSTSTILPPGVPDLANAGASWLEVRWSHAPNGDVVKYVLQYSRRRPEGSVSARR